MAKKKSNKNVKPAHKEVDTKETTSTNMQSKVEVKQPERNNERVSRIVGSVFIGLGVLLVAFGIYSFIRFREEPTLDTNLEAPVLEDVTALTNGDKVYVRGNANGYDNVFVYVNDDMVKNVKVNGDGNFEYEYVVESEGEYSITVAGVKGFPNRFISPKTSSKISVVDWTAPVASDVKLTYGEETNKDTFTIIGNAEPLSILTVKRGTQAYDALVAEDGSFKIKDIYLEEGKNVFTVSVTDKAGNTAELDEKVRVTYNPSGNVNGDAVIDSNIPQASGELDFLKGNQLMMVFAMLAVLAFAGSSMYVYTKKNN